MTVGLCAALPASPALADDGSVTVVQPASKTVANGDVRTITFKTSDAWTPLSPPQVTITRHNDPTKTDTVDGSGESVDSTDPTRVTASFDLKLANPADYDITVTGTKAGPPPGQATDTCVTSATTECLHVVESNPPTVTAVSPASVSADDAYPNWVVNGSGFTEGPYVQCTSVPCDTSKPSVAILDSNGFPDSGVTLTKSDQPSTAHQIPMVLSVFEGDPGGLRSVVVTNTDGQSATCTNCLAIAPAMTVSSISPNHMPAGSSGQTLVISGANFPLDVQASFVRESNDTTTGDVAWSTMTVTSNQITLSNVAIAANAPTGNETLVLHSDTTHGNSSFPGQFAVGGSPPTPPVQEHPPTNVVASGGDQQAFVQWTPPQSSSADKITGYVVKTLPDGNPSTPAPANARSATVGPLTNGQPYRFTVTVTFQTGNSYTSLASNEATPSGRPDAPNDVQATAGNRNATVTWAAPASDNGTPIDSYTVTSSPDGVKAVVFAQGSQPPPTNAVVSGLKNGTAYVFTVVAHNGGGNSADSDPSNSVTPIGDPTLTFKGPQTIDKGTSAKLHGQLIGSNGKPVAGAPLKLQQRHSGAHQFGTLKVLKTSASGRWSFSVKPSSETRYRIRWSGDKGNRPVVSGHTILVRETSRINSPKDGTQVLAGDVTVRGHASSGKGAPVSLQERRNGNWVTIANGTIESHGKVVLHAKLTHGKAVLRLKAAGRLGTLPGYSAPVTLTVD
jgi:hypothetical protein